MISVSNDSDLMLTEMPYETMLKFQIFPSFFIQAQYFPKYNEEQLKTLDMSPFCAYNIIDDEYISLSSEKFCVLIKISRYEDISSILSSISSKTLVASTEIDVDYCDKSILSPESDESLYILLSVFLNLLPKSESDKFTISSYLELSSVSLMTYFLHRYHFPSKQFTDSDFFDLRQDNYKKYELSDLVPLRTIGTGRFGEVSLVFDASSGILFALKTFNDESKYEQEKLLYSSNNNSFLVHGVGYVEENGILMEFMSNGSLSDHIDDKKLTPTERSKIIYRLLAAVDYLHSKGITHCGITTKHALFDHNMNIYLSDYDSVNEPDFSFNHDIYSLGLLIYELSTKQAAFGSQSLSVSLAEVMKGNIPELSSDCFKIQQLYYSMMSIGFFPRQTTFQLLKKKPFYFKDTDKRDFKSFYNDLVNSLDTFHPGRVDLRGIISLANSGENESVCHLAILHQEGLIIKKDEKKAEELFNQAAHRGNAHAQYSLGLILRAKNPSKSNEMLLKSARQGYDPAQYAIGENYFNGTNVEIDYNMSLYWLTMAGNQGNSDAQVLIGKYYFGDYAKDVSKAAHWFLKSASRGNAEAFHYIGYFYLNGIFFIENRNKSLEYFFEAAIRKNPNSMFAVGMSYIDGTGVGIDVKKGVEWILKAAKYGDLSAKEILGIYYFLGTYVPKDNQKAIGYLLECTGQGYLNGDSYLAMIYIEGYYIKQDIQKGLDLLTNAADQGNMNALVRLGRLFETGKYVNRDLEKALSCYQSMYDIRKESFNIFVLASFLIGHGEEEKGLEILNEIPKDAPIDYKICYTHIMIKNGRNIQESISFLKEGVENGFAPAQSELAKLYIEGKYVSKNMNEAIDLLEKAAEKGNYDACFELGQIFENMGEIEKAIKLYKKASFIPKQEVVSKLKQLAPDFEIDSISINCQPKVLFACFTCSLFSPMHVSAYCAINCHQNHDLIDLGSMLHMFCTCGTRGSQCQYTEQEIYKEE